MSDRVKLLTLLLLVFVFYTAVSVCYMRVVGGGLTAFLHVGSRFYNPMYFPNGTHVRSDDGYDGQFYYYVALDPFIKGNVYKQIDSPSYRYQRVFYPLLSSLLSFGKVRLLPFIMWLINLLAVVGGVYYVVKTARLFGVKKWFLIGGLYAASVGLVMCVLRDLAEPLAILLLLGAIYYYMNRAFCVSSLFLAFGVLTKEIGVVVAIVVLLWYVLHEDRRRLKCILCFSLPVFLLGGWHLYIWFRLGVLPYVQGSSNFGLPFNAVRFIVNYMLSGRSLATRVMMAFFFASFLLSLLIGVRLLLKRYISLPLLLLLVFLGISTLFTPLIWGGNWSYPRVFLYVYALLFIVYFEYKEQLILLPILGMTFLPLIPFAALHH